MSVSGVGNAVVERRLKIGQPCFERVGREKHNSVVSQGNVFVKDNP